MYKLILILVLIILGNCTKTGTKSYPDGCTYNYYLISVTVREQRHAPMDINIQVNTKMIFVTDRVL